METLGTVGKVLIQAKQSSATSDGVLVSCLSVTPCDLQCEDRNKGGKGGVEGHVGEGSKGTILSGGDSKDAHRK